MRFLDGFTLTKNDGEKLAEVSLHVDERKLLKYANRAFKNKHGKCVVGPLVFQVEKKFASELHQQKERE